MPAKKEDKNQIKNQIGVGKEEKQEMENNLNGITVHSKKTNHKVNNRPCGKCFCCFSGKNVSDDNISDIPSLSAASHVNDDVTVVEVARSKTKKAKQKKELPNFLPEWIISRFAYYLHFCLSLRNS